MYKTKGLNELTKLNHLYCDPISIVCNSLIYFKVIEKEKWPKIFSE